MPETLRSSVRSRSRIFVHWKSLVIFGVIFWFLLCAFDILGGGPHKYVYDIKDYDLLYKTFSLEKSKDGADKQFIPKLQNFGISLLVWNSVTFLGSVVFCYLIKMFWWICAKSYYLTRNKRILSTLTPNISPCINERNSKIPVKIRSNAICFKEGDSQVKLSKTILVSDDSSSSVNAEEINNTNLSEGTLTSLSKYPILYKNKGIALPTIDTFEKIEAYVDNYQLNKLRQEILKIQDNSLKEQSELSTKIDALTKEKKELSKQLVTTQKENRAAKQQIEELAQNKKILIKKLEAINQVVKSSTKSKKVALAKMEELSSNSNNLKKQLEQVTRDKDILEDKIKILQEEYERLQERIILTDNHTCPEYQNTPERDTDEIIQRNKPTYIKNLDVVQSISETELDVKKIQLKIQQLEQNLKTFNSNKDTINLQVTDESDISLSNDESSKTELKSETTTELNSELKTKEEEKSYTYDYNFPGSPNPTFSYWPSKINPYLGNISQLSMVPNDKNEALNDFRTIEMGLETEKDEYSSSEDSVDEIESTSKMVSSSTAFKNFLKNI